jgi:hypothetical protein
MLCIVVQFKLTFFKFLHDKMPCHEFLFLQKSFRNFWNLCNIIFHKMTSWGSFFSFFGRNSICGAPHPLPNESCLGGVGVGKAGVVGKGGGSRQQEGGGKLSVSWALQFCILFCAQLKDNVHENMQQRNLKNLVYIGLFFPT